MTTDFKTFLGKHAPLPPRQVWPFSNAGHDWHSYFVLPGWEAPFCQWPSFIPFASHMYIQGQLNYSKYCVIKYERLTQWTPTNITELYRYKVFISLNNRFSIIFRNSTSIFVCIGLWQWKKKPAIISKTPSYFYQMNVFIQVLYFTHCFTGPPPDMKSNNCIMHKILAVTWPLFARVLPTAWICRDTLVSRLDILIVMFDDHVYIINSLNCFLSG